MRDRRRRRRRDAAGIARAIVTALELDGGLDVFRELVNEATRDRAHAADVVFWLAILVKRSQQQRVVDAFRAAGADQVPGPMFVAAVDRVRSVEFARFDPVGRGA